MTTYQRFVPARRLGEYRGQIGHEIGGMALSPYALQALAESATSGKPCELEVIGQWVHDDGRRFLDFGVTRPFIETTTDYRFDKDQHRFRLVCQDCGLKDGKHTKACDR